MTRPEKPDQTKFAAARIGKVTLWLFVIGMILNTCADQETMASGITEQTGHVYANHAPLVK